MQHLNLAAIAFQAAKQFKFREFLPGGTVAELIRLSRMPRYKMGESSLLGIPLKFVDATTFSSGYREIFLRRIYEFEAETDQPYIIDCGANVGLSIIFVKRLYPQANVLAYEPDPVIFEVCRENIDRCQLSSVDLRQEAVWHKEEEVDFWVEGGFSGRIVKPGDSDREIRVKATRLREHLDRQVDFLKIDIEGAEYEVLMDCVDSLKYVHHIFIEYHSHIAETQWLDAILAVLTRAGFRYHVHDAFTVPQPFVDRNTLVGMDLQLNIYGYRLSNQ